MPSRPWAFVIGITGLWVALGPAGRALGQPRDPRIVVPPAFRDANLDRIDDALEVKIATGTLIGPGPGAPVVIGPGLVRGPIETGRKPYADLLVCFDHPPNDADAQQIIGLGGQVVHAWSELVFCMNVRLPAALVAAGGTQAVAALPQVSFVEENHRARLQLHYSTRQTRARSAWARTTAIDGDSTIRIAICDTGLDGTYTGSAHGDLTGKIAAWYDAYYAVQGGTNYTSAVDENGHGSHVGGIVAGTGASAGIDTGNGTTNRTHSALFSATAGNIWNVNPARMPVDTTGIGTTSSISSSTYWSTSPSPGAFVIAELWDSAFDSDPGSASLNWDFEPVAGSQPLNVAYNFLSSGIQDFKYIGSPYPYENNGGDAWYVSQNACRQVAVGDGYNLNAGVAPACSLVGVRVVDKWGSGDSGASELIDGLSWISTNRDTYDIVAVNMSLAYGTGPAGALDTAVDNLVGNGVVCVASAGNDRGTAGNIGEPGTASRAITIAATSELDKITGYSSEGGSGSGKPDVAAPGGSLVTRKDITSIDTGDSEYVHDYAGTSDAILSTERFADDYAGKTGTSMSAPHVAGLVGLIVDAMGGMGSWDWSLSQALFVKSIILMTATETNQTAEATPDPTLDRGGKDTCEGYGRINVDAAVSAIADEMVIATDGTASDSTSFDSDPTGRKCWARYVQLKRNSRYVFSMTVPSGCDADLYLYDDTPDSDGNPDIALYSTTSTTAGNTETFTRPVITPGDASTDTYYLAAKLVSGSGVMNISSITVTAAEVSNLHLAMPGRRPRLEWHVSNPELLAGFNVFAAADLDGPWEKCNDRLIIARGGMMTWDPPARAVRKGVQYLRLESVDLYGAKTDHGYAEAGR